MRLFFEHRIGRVSGVALLVLGMSAYSSAEHREFFGRWSAPYFAVLCALAMGLVGLAWRSFRLLHERKPDVRTRAFDLGVLIWGAAYLIQSHHPLGDPGRLLEGNLVGSPIQLAAVLEWIAVGLGLFVLLTSAAPRVRPEHRPRLFALSAVLVAVFAVEGFARVWYGAFPETQGFPTHPTTMWKARYAQENSRGFRSAEFEPRKSAKDRKLLVIGDSYAYGLGVDRAEDRLGERLAAYLSEARHENWQALHAATPGANTLVEIEYLKKSLDYEPDLVLLVYVFNDVDYLLPKSESAVGTGAIGRWDVLGRLNPLRLAFANSYLFQQIWVRGRMARFALWPGTRRPWTLDRELVRRHMDDLSRFVELARSAGAIVVIAPFDLGVLGRRAERYEQFLEDAEAAHLPILSLRHAFDGYSLHGLGTNSLDSHPNKLAHGIAAAALGPQVEEVLSTRLGREPLGKSSHPAL